MKTIRISDEVWNAIAARGRFGETEDDVLCRVFKIENSKPITATTARTKTAREAQNSRTFGWKERRAQVPMFQKVKGNKLILEFQTGQRGEWDLPSKENSAGIRQVRDLAVEFVRTNGGTAGQVGAAMRALTSRGYHVTLKNQRSVEFA